MPNFWSNTTQSIQEILVGPRTVDTELEEKCVEFKEVVMFSNNIIKIINNKISFLTESIKYYTEMINDLKSIPSYFKDYKDDFITIINYYTSNKELSIKLLFEIKKELQSFTDLMKGVNLIEQKLEDSYKKRKDYNHYDEKLEDLYSKFKKMQVDEKKKEDCSKLQEYIDKNELKFEKVTKDYIEINKSCYKAINNFISSREPGGVLLLKESIDGEFEFLSKTSSEIEKLKDLSINLKLNCDSRMFKLNAKIYDPYKFYKLYRRQSKSVPQNNLNLDPNEIFYDFQNTFSSSNK